MRRAKPAVIVSGRCRACGCTENDARRCIERTGIPCRWVDVRATKCSACFTASGKRKRGGMEK